MNFEPLSYYKYHGEVNGIYIEPIRSYGNISEN